MMKTRNMLVCLDLSEIDQTIIEYCSFLLREVISVQKVIFFHNIRFDFLGEYTFFTSEEISKLKKRIRNEISQECKASFTGIPAPPDFSEIVWDKNSTGEAILEIIKQEKIDLILMGNKGESLGAGVIPQKILSLDKQKTPMLLIPAYARNRLEKLLVSVDFSPSASKAIQTAEHLSVKARPEKTSLHVYKLPMTYFPYIEESGDAFLKETSTRAQKRMLAFMKSLQIEHDSWELTTQKGSSVAKTLLSHISSQSIDLFVSGRIGKTGLMGNRIGGVTRSLLRQSMSIPWLIV